MTNPDSRFIRLIEAIIKNLPPSASQLRLLDINGVAGEMVQRIRPDVHITPMSGDVSHWQFPENSFDAVVAVEYILNTPFLHAVLPILRHGGRLIVANSRASLSATQYGTQLEDAGYIRILIEDALQNPPSGVLMRGEKAHITADTHARIQQVAGADQTFIPITEYKGRYVHLLIRQTPNKPVWRIEPDEPIQWEAVTINHQLIAFSSLPKAVSFMQPSVMANKLYQVNKVGKFKPDVLLNWSLPILLNPTMTIWDNDGTLGFIAVNHADAEAPDE